MIKYLCSQIISWTGPNLLNSETLLFAPLSQLNKQQCMSFHSTSIANSFSLGKLNILGRRKHFLSHSIVLLLVRLGLPMNRCHCYSNQQYFIFVFICANCSSSKISPLVIIFLIIYGVQHITQFPSRIVGIFITKRIKKDKRKFLIILLYYKIW